MHNESDMLSDRDHESATPATVAFPSNHLIRLRHALRACPDGRLHAHVPAAALLLRVIL